MKNHIHTKSFLSFADFVWDGKNMDTFPAAGKVFVHADNIYQFFNKCCGENAPEYTLISAESDFGLHLQEEYPPNKDLLKLVNYAPWAKAAEEKNQYVQMPIGPACKANQCNIKDKFSFKTFNWTLCTFQDIPKNIKHWYVANLNIEHPKVTWIPFGIMEGTEIPKNLMHSRKDGLLYVNFEVYTQERVYWKNYFAQPWVTYRPICNLSREKYWQEIAQHKFVLCPEGNGLDCYRTYETLYLNSIPVMQRNTFSKHIEKAGLPVLLVDRFDSVDRIFLQRQWEIMSKKTYDFSKISLDYWQNILSN